MSSQISEAVTISGIEIHDRTEGPNTQKVICMLQAKVFPNKQN